MTALPATSRSTLPRALVVGCGGLGSPASRVLTPTQARRVGSTYSDTEFDLTRLRHLRERQLISGGGRVLGLPNPQALRELAGV